MSETLWSFEKRRIEGRNEGITEGIIVGNKRTAYEMFQDGMEIDRIRKYSMLSDNILAEVLGTLPKKIQQNYNLMATV